MPELVPVLTREEIADAVEKLAGRLSSDYREGRLVLVGVLKGAFLFLADLARAVSIPVRIDFMRAASYGSGTSSSGSIRLTKDVELDLRDTDVVLVEDIVDSGLTLSFLIDHVRAMGPRSVKVCTLIDKRERRQCDVPVDYACHVIDEGFLVGYGLDFDERYRELPGIFHLKL